MIKEEVEKRKNKFKDICDDPDDVTCFEIQVINRKDAGIAVDCRVQDGNVAFNRIRHLKQGEALAYTRSTWVDRSWTTDYKGPHFRYLSENVQTHLVEYFYEIGINPEIGLAVEYLSLNKD